MADAKRTVTIKSVAGNPWTKPGTKQNWYSVVIEEYPSEPIKFIQDEEKGAPVPEVGKKYQGNAYVNDGKTKFYAFGDTRPSQPAQTELPVKEGKDNYWAEKDAQIRAQFAIKASIQLLTRGTPNGTDITEDMLLENAQMFYAMVDRVKGSDVGDNDPGPSDEEMPEPEFADVVTGGVVDLDSIPF